MTDTLTLKDTRKILDLLEDHTNAQIADLAGITRANTVTVWKKNGLPRTAAALILYRLAARKRAAIEDLQADLTRLDLLQAQHGLV